MSDTQAKETWDINQIMEFLPHRFPFLLVDQVEEVNRVSGGGPIVGSDITCRKCVSINEPFFQGHFPVYPVMPGVLIVEAMAQVGAVAILSQPEHRGRLAFFAGIDGVRFRRQVRPGDELRMEVVLKSFKLGVGKGEARAFVGDTPVATGLLTFALGAKPEAAS